MRKAVIDLGTNTFNLLIVEVFPAEKPIVIHQEKEGVALGMGGINSNVISKDAVARGIKALVRYKMICENHEVSKIKAIGTSALRAAKNSTEFISQVKELTGIEIEIITGKKEAQYIFQGVKSTYSFSLPSLIMDIGGGSTEFIFVNNSKVIQSESFEIGVSRIYQKNSFSDPLSKTDVDTINNYLEYNLGEFLKKIKTNILIGASGSFETFYELINDEDFPQRGAAIEINMTELKTCLSEIIESTQEERNLNNRIIPIRKIMAPIAAVKILFILNKLSINTIFVSSCSLKEGVLSSF